VGWGGEGEGARGGLCCATVRFIGFFLQKQF
jgi:hypothetical protein